MFTGWPSYSPENGYYEVMIILYLFLSHSVGSYFVSYDYPVFGLCYMWDRML